MKNRIHYLNVIRLLATAAIIYYHLIVEFLAGGLITPEQAPFYTNDNFNIASAAVALFFMISGASLMASSLKKKKFSIGNYYLGRFFRILIPYYVATLVVFIVIHGATVPPGMSRLTLPLHLFALDGYATALGMPNVFYMIIGEWFMGCLVLIYAVYPIIRLAVLKKPAVTFFLATVGYVLLVVFYPFAIPPHQNLFLKTYEFGLGALLVLVKDRIPNIVLVPSALVVVLFLVLPFNIPIYDAFKITAFAVSCFILLAKAEGIFSKMKIFNKVVDASCKYSYEIFLGHHMIIANVMVLYGARLSVPQMCLVSVVLSVIFGIAVHYTSKGLTFLIKLPFKLAANKK